MQYATKVLNYPNEITFTFATLPSEQPGNGPVSLNPGTTVEEAAALRDAHIFDTLAASYAENGQFDEAIKWQKEACKEVGQANQFYMPIVLQKMNQRLALYEKHQPYREGKL